LIKIGNIELPDFPLLLASMEDVSDPLYRILCKMHGADMVYSEFISSEGLIRDATKSRMKLDNFGQKLCFVNFVLLEVFNSYLFFVFIIPFRRFCRQGD
jgi:tRNA-dihydrouridine synthase